MQSVQSKYGYGMTASACLWLGLFPLLQGGTYTHITWDKWVIMLVLAGVTLLSFLFDLLLRLKQRGRAEKPPRAGVSVRSLLPFLLASALLAWTVLSCLFSGYDPEIWWLGKAARYEGLATQLCYYALFACFFFSRVRLKHVLFSAAAGVAVFLVVVLLQRAGGNPLGLYPGAYRVEFQGTIGNIDMGTGYLLLLSGLFLRGLIGALRKPAGQRSPVLAAVCAAALLIAVFLIVTMEVQFGLIGLGVLFLVTLLRFIPKKVRLPLLLILIAAVLLAVWFCPVRTGGVWELHEILHGRGRLSFGSNRVAVWYYSLLLARTAPLLGGGSGTFQPRFNSFLADQGLAIPTEQDGRSLPAYFDMPHNEYIAMLTNHGLPAMLLFLALLLFAVFRRREGWLPLPGPCSAAVLCYAVQAFFSFSVCIVAPMFWVVLGLSFSSDPA